MPGIRIAGSTHANHEMQGIKWSEEGLILLDMDLIKIIRIIVILIFYLMLGSKKLHD